MQKRTPAKLPEENMLDINKNNTRFHTQKKVERAIQRKGSF